MFVWKVASVNLSETYIKIKIYIYVGSNIYNECWWKKKKAFDVIYILNLIILKLYWTYETVIQRTKWTTLLSAWAENKILHEKCEKKRELECKPKAKCITENKNTKIALDANYIAKFTMINVDWENYNYMKSNVTIHFFLQF